ncbi:hypothetical protein LTR78_004693 [Recurvomyces mirabilis]|uniref:Uncharacterized protein n=1 Tax=Recurvomyces mirabilis TaxID=574656 RepID=A0AAE1C2H0_9PEZI|nr:hypothetical protein LTR78_004693 [Recurvomyces mirabilis]KAK5152813.1 hypothetical protein LTS14_007920 [Recurvomyces mirabilis]
MPRPVHIDRTLAARLNLDQDALAKYLATLNISTTAGTGAAATANTTSVSLLPTSTTSSTSTPALTPSENSRDNRGGACLTPRATSTTASTSSRAHGVLLTPSASTITFSAASSAGSDNDSASSTPTITNTRDDTVSISGASSTPTNEDVLAFFNTQYGKGGRLEGYQKLCEHLDVSPIPSSITRCKKALEDIHINIRDFVQAYENGDPVPRFSSVSGLRQDIKGGRQYPLKIAKANPILSGMLVTVYFKK